MKRIGIIHYDEIALKGENRKTFEQKLISNVARKIKELQIPVTLENRWGRIVMQIDEKYQDTTSLSHILATTPGVTVFGIGVAIEKRDVESISAATIAVLDAYNEEFETFRISTTRVDKQYTKTSQDINQEIGAFLVAKTGKSVKLKEADIDIRIEILHNIVYVYVRQQGISGLAVGSSGKAVALLSGGFDSPVAAYLCATRGVEPLLLHFHAYPQTSKAAMEKVEDLAKQLRTFCGPLTLAFAPLLEAQKEIALTAPEKLRVILYRRLMMRVAQQWGEDRGAQAIITGESVGQVASQTLENIRAVEDATSLPVLRPLSGMHKKDIINISRTIGTHDISILPHDDTCTLFMPKRPETKAHLAYVRAAEEKYDSDALVTHILNSIDVHVI